MDFIIDNGHDGKKICNPSWTQIEKSLREIDEDTCCFFILTADTGSYLQCAGGQFAVTLEFREMLNGSFKHFVLGKGQVTGALKTIWTTIDCRVGPIRIHKDEILTLADAIAAFAHFFEKSAVLPALTRRNVTKHFDV